MTVNVVLDADGCIRERLGVGIWNGGIKVPAEATAELLVPSLLGCMALEAIGQITPQS
jgi:hypothetical protein